ncbi:major facilitator superfamily domain-containing protein [Umbelopsis sp. PMI_123]|nr:major facilitator superfamily domain-containing protein [Umbelopsis sp. PMI_123]
MDTKEEHQLEAVTTSSNNVIVVDNDIDPQDERYKAIERRLASYYVLRFLLGVMEAGLWPGMAFVMSKFYKKYETAVRVGFYFFSAPVASVVTGFFAAGFQLIDGRGHLYGFQWLFLIFGLLAIIVGVEMDVARHRLATDNGTDGDANPKITVGAVLREILDYKVYLFTICYMCTVLMNTSMQYYSQTIVLQMGYTSINASLMIIPVGDLVCISALLATKMSDSFKTRSYPYVLFAVIAAVGFAVLSFTGTNAARYAGLCLVGLGIGPGAPLSTSWALNSKYGEVSVAITTAIVSGLAQLGIVFSTFFLYTGWPSHAPR